MTTPKALPQYVPRAMPPSDTDLMHAGKRPAEMSREELIVAAVHFRDAHAESVYRMAEMARRMKKLEEAVHPDKVKKLDRWLRAHGTDSLKGDGSELYPNWQKWDGTDGKPAS